VPPDEEIVRRLIAGELMTSFASHRILDLLGPATASLEWREASAESLRPPHLVVPEESCVCA
jgi:hypothetical protein